MADEIKDFPYVVLREGKVIAMFKEEVDRNVFLAWLTHSNPYNNIGVEDGTRKKI
jgi:hypothetical protein